MDEQTPAAASRGRRVWLWLGLWLVVGLAARLATVAIPHVMGSFTVSGRPISSWANKPFFPDTLEFTGIAKNLRAGEGLGASATSQIARMPAYPVLLAVVQTLFGEAMLPARLADAVLGTVAVLLVYLLAREVYGEREGLIAAAIVALYPFFVLQALLVLSETLFIVFLLAASLFLAKARKGGGLGWSALAGLAFGLATLTRGVLLPVVFLAALGWAAARRLKGQVVSAALVMVAAFVLAMTPWAARNWRVTGGHLVLTTLRVGPSLYEGLNPEADGGPMMDRINWNVGTDDLSEYERDRHWRRMALQYACEHPGRALVLAGIKLARYWNVVPNLEQFKGFLPCATLGASYALVMVLALVGLARSWRRGEVALILLMPVVYHALVHAVFVGSVRYRAAMMPLLVVVAAHGFETLWTRWRRGRPAAGGERVRVKRGGDRGRASGAPARGARRQAPRGAE